MVVGVGINPGLMALNGIGKRCANVMANLNDIAMFMSLFAGDEEFAKLEKVVQAMDDMSEVDPNYHIKFFSEDGTVHESASEAVEYWREKKIGWLAIIVDDKMMERKDKVLAEAFEAIVPMTVCAGLPPKDVIEELIGDLDEKVDNSEQTFYLFTRIR